MMEIKNKAGTKEGWQDLYHLVTWSQHTAYQGLGRPRRHLGVGGMHWRINDQLARLARLQDQETGKAARHVASRAASIGKPLAVSTRK